MRFVSSASCIALIALAGSGALAQHRGGGFRGQSGGFGGGRAQTSRPAATAQPSAQPQFRPMQVAPWPGVSNTPRSAPRPPLAPQSSGGNFFNGTSFGESGFTSPGSGAPGMRGPGTGRGVRSDSGAPAVGRPGMGGQGFRGSAPEGFVGRGSISSGSGLTVNGAYADGNWRLAFHLGSNAFAHPICRPYGYGTQCYYPGSYPGLYPVWWGYGSYYGDYYGNRYGDIYGFYSEPDPGISYVPTPAPAPHTEAVVPSTNRELGDTYLRAGDARAAIKAYQSHLKQYPGDEEAMRALGMALIDNGQTTEGVAMISMAYKAEPLLADRPISADTFRYGSEGLARNVSRASIYANRVKTPSAWLAVATLMQAQGRDDLAKTMIERARAAGLDAVIADRMISALH